MNQSDVVTAGGVICSCLVKGFDIRSHAGEHGLRGIELRMRGRLGGLGDGARFVCFQNPASLDEKIEQVKRAAWESDSAQRWGVCVEYGRDYEMMGAEAKFRRSVCGLMLVSDKTPNYGLMRDMSAVFGAWVKEGQWPELLEGSYEVVDGPVGHLRPEGKAGKRPVWGILRSYAFQEGRWSFNRPMGRLMGGDFPIAIAVDIPSTLSGVEAMEEVKRVGGEYGIVTGSAEEEGKARQLANWERMAADVSRGDGFHKVQIMVAVSAPDVEILRERGQAICEEMQPWASLSWEKGEALERAVRFFSTASTKEIDLGGTWCWVTSRKLTCMLSPIGYPGLGDTSGVLRGEGHGATSYPVFYESWREERSGRHEVWVGGRGCSKRIALRNYLLREYAENGVRFDVVETQGIGKSLEKALEVKRFALSSRATVLNPQDVMFAYKHDQIAHSVRIYESILGRALSGGRVENIQRGVLGEALRLAYGGEGWEINGITPDRAPRTDLVVDILSGVSNPERADVARIAKDLADELGSLCTGSGPWASFVNGETNVDLLWAGRGWGAPRIFDLSGLESNPAMLGIAYAQVVAAICHDARMEEGRRIVVLDKVSRLIGYPGLGDVLVEAMPTLRCRRKKAIVVDDEMSVFLGKDRLRFIFENCAVRMIFRQENVDVFREDPAFQHLDAGAVERLRKLAPLSFLMDACEDGEFWLRDRGMDAEQRLFGEDVEWDLAEGRD